MGSIFVLVCQSVRELERCVNELGFVGCNLNPDTSGGFFNGPGLRNCINAGLPSLPCPGVLDVFAEGDVAEVDWTTGTVRNVTSGATTTGNPIPPQLRDIILGGGVEGVLRREGYLAEPSPLEVRSR